MKLLELKKRKRLEASKGIQTITDAAADEERELTDAEETLCTEFRSQVDALEPQIEVLEKDAESAKTSQLPAEQRSHPAGPEGGADDPDMITVEKRSAAGTVKVTRETLMYERKGPNNFWTDLFHYQAHKDRNRHFRSSQDAIDRIERHIEESEERATLTSNLSGLVVPQYLTEMTAPSLYNGRVSAMACARYPMPADGESLTIPRFTTKANTGVQNPQGTDVQASSPATTSLTLGVTTVAGSIEVSRQSIDRGTMVASFLENELMGAYAEDINNQVLYGSGADTQQKGMLTAGGGATFDNYTLAAPTLVAIWQRIIRNLGLVGANRKRAADIIITSPLLWSKLYAALDGDNRPLFQWLLNTSQNVMGVGDPAMADVLMPTPVGEIAGIPVLTDPAITDTFTQADASTAGTQSRVITARREDMIAFENAEGPAVATYEQTEAKKLLYTLVVYGYFTYTNERYSQGVRVIKGTGMVAP